MLKLCFAGLDASQPVIPLALACGLGTSHAYSHRSNAIATLQSRAPQLWISAPIEEARVVVYPHRYEDTPETRRVAEAAKARNLPCIFFEHWDAENPARPPYGTIYRTALDSSRRRPGDQAMSGLSDDMLLEAGRDSFVRPKGPRPVVGFCGNTGGIADELKNLVLGRGEIVSATRLRRSVLRSLAAHRDVETRFIERKRYWGGAVRAPGGKVRVADAEALARLRSDFVANILDTDYTVCIRGAGNYSIRFYEALSAGRIPLFLNTRCVLPFEDRIDWRRHCVWVEAEDSSRVGDILEEFHSRLGDGEFRELQQANRRLWMEWLEATAFYQRVLADAVAGRDEISRA